MRRVASQPLPLWRFYVLVGVLCILLVLLVWRVLSLQILDLEHGYEFLQDQGAMRSVRTAEIPAYRGVITDRRGEPLAVSTPVVSIWANPQLLKDSTRLEELAQALDMTLPVLQEKLSRYEGKQFMYLLRHQVPAYARTILDKKISGVFSEREYRRFYPAGEVAAQLVGFTNVDGQGIAGLELTYNDWLQGRPGKKKYIKDLHGEMVRDIGVLQPAQSGKDIRLSIDLRLQYVQHRELQRAVTALGAESGTVVTMDSHTGEVLAMVNYPVYNPNGQKSGGPAGMRNRAITDVYEPGSTMKSLTMVAALESGRFTPETMIDTSPGRIRVGPKVYPDPRNYGLISITRILQKSSQVGVTKIALDLGHEPIWEVFQRFGIGQAPGTGFPGESAGNLPNRPRWYATEKVSLAFGYGISATPLQLASAYSVFANGGVQQPVSLLAVEGDLPEGKRVIAPDTAAKLMTMLHAVTNEQGTARKARVQGYQVGGKTGTVHKVGPGGYEKNKYVALFAGVAPIDNPRIVTVVVINDPKGALYGGGSVAAPVFSEITRATMRILSVPPSETTTVGVAATVKAGGQNLMLAAQPFSAQPMSLPQLLGSDNAAYTDIMISGMQLDSRKVRPGDLFLALPGEMHDGRQFIEQAVANGAIAVLAEAPVAGFVDVVPVPLVEVPELHCEAGLLAAKFYCKPSSAMHVMGVTGTNGKTTTTRIIAQLTRALGNPCGVIGTLGATLTDDVAAASNTTPDALSLQQQLAQWLAQGVVAVSMEVSSHALDQGRVNGVEFATAIFTNLSHDHLDYHGSMDAYGRAKLRLFASEGLQYAVINADDPFVDNVRCAVNPGAQVVTYSARGAAADVRIVNALFQADGVRAELHSPWGVAEFFSPLPGDFNLANLAAAVAALVLSGESLPAVLDAVSQLQPVPGRMALVPNTQDFQVIIDYAHTPHALEQVLMALRPYVSGSLVTVFGCGGERDREKRQIMGRVACSLSDRVVVTSDNPRSEEPLQIMREIESGCTGEYTLIADRAQAIAAAVASASAGDCVVIAGKGHEDYQLIDGARLPFSDEAHARAALEGRAAS